MADEIAGRLFIELLPDVDKKKFQAAINKAVVGTEATVPTTLKLTKTAVSDVITEANTKLAARKNKPVLKVDLALNAASITPLIADANARLAARKRPKLKVDLDVVNASATAAAAKKAAKQSLSYEEQLTSKIRAQYDNRGKIADTNYAKDLRKFDAQYNKRNELSAIQASKEATSAVVNYKYREQLADTNYAKDLRKFDAQFAKKDQIIALNAGKRAANISVDAANIGNIELIEQAKTAGRLNAAVEKGLDQRSIIEARAAAQGNLIELRAAKQRELINLRADNNISRSRTSTLRLLRNDLSNFDVTTSRVLRRLGFGFGVFTTTVAASFAAITVGALRSFADTEVQIRRTAAVLGTAAFTQAAARGEDAFAAFGRKVEEVGSQLESIVNLAALRTVFDPTETARGARALAQAGATVENIQASLLSIARFAQNEEILPEDAVQQLASGATAAGLSISNLNSLADKFTFVANNTTASAKEVAEAFANRAAPAFRAYGQSVDQTLTVLNLFAAAGIRGKTAGEQTGILIREINKAATKTPDTTAAFKKYGIQVGSVNGRAVEFTTTLAQLANLFEQVRKEQGATGLARLRKELGLTEKSGAGLIQILPQITDLQLSGLQNITKQIARSRGATERQADVITRTLSFQVEQFSNQITALFKTAAGPLAKGLTDIFLGLNGEIEGTVGITERLTAAFQRGGERIAKTLLPALRRFAFGGEGEAFIKGLRDLYAGTIIGLRDAFIAFRREAFGDAEGRGFFSLLGAAFGAIGRSSQIALPIIAGVFGRLTKFINENGDTVSRLIKLWAGTFIFSKTLRLAIVPASNLLDQMKGLKSTVTAIAASSFGVWLIESIRGMRGLTAATKSATAATTALAAAQAGAAGTGVAAGAAGAAGAAAAGAATLKKASQFATGALIGGLLAPLALAGSLIDNMYLGVAKLLNGFKKLGNVRGLFAGIGSAGSTLLGVIRGVVSALRVAIRFAGPIGVIIAAIQLAVGAVRGFFDEIKKSSSSSEEFKNSLEEIRPIIDAVVSGLRAVGSAALDVIGVFFRLGESVGRAFGGVFRTAVIILGDVVRIFKEIAAGNFTAAFKALGDVITNALLAPFKLALSFLVDIIGDVFESLKSLPVVGDAFASVGTKLGTAAASIRNFNVNLSEAEKTVAKTKSSVYLAKLGVEGYTQAISVLGINSVLASQRSTQFADRNRNLSAVLGIVANRARDTASYQYLLAQASRSASANMLLLAGSRRRLEALFAMAVKGSKSATKSLLEMRTASIILARDTSIQKLTRDHMRLAGSIRVARNEEYLLAVQRIKTSSATRIKSVAKDLAAELDTMRGELKGAFADADLTAGIAGTADVAAESVKEVKTAAEQATEAVNKLSQAQLNRQAASLVGRVSRAAATGYKATAVEADVLRRTLPAVEAQLQRQQDAIAKLDEALQNLQGTQLKGTRAFSDQAFAIEQSIKQLQLQRLDLIIAGTPEQDTAIAALDDQISQLQQKTERLSLVESLQLDPLRRKLEQTFNPIKELTFDEIIKQFQSIQAQRAPLTQAIAGGENLRATLETTIKDAEARFGDAGRQVTAGFANGIKGSTPQVALAGKTIGTAALNGVNNVMQFGSPSRTMIQRGEWVVQGFTTGINNNLGSATSAGVDVMFGFLTGMRNVYENRIQPFVRGIAVWIKENKGPVAYDATLLRPAGEAMMQGFHRGLRDGFSEVKTWVSDVGPDLARHTIPDKIFKKMSAEFIIGNATADMKFDPGEFFASIAPMGEIGPGAGFLGQSLGLEDTIRQARMIAQMFGITPNIASARRRAGDPGYNAAIGGAANSLHISGRAMDFTGMDSRLTDAANWARKYTDMIFQEVLWQTTGHYDHLHLGWKFGDKKLIADIAGASRIVEEALANASNLTKVDFNLLAAIAKAESGFNPSAVSPVGAGGLMQLMPGTARSLGVANVFDPKQNALGGAKYIKQMLEMFNGNIRIALAGYNAGPGNAMLAMRSFSETIAYIEKVMRYFNQFKSGNYRAQGGKVNAMTPYIVGERGQELFIPSQNGSVVSNRDLRNLIDALRGAQQNGLSATGTTINDNRRFEVISNSTDPATVAALVDARIRSQVVGVRR